MKQNSLSSVLLHILVSLCSGSSTNGAAIEDDGFIGAIIGSAAHVLIVAVATFVMVCVFITWHIRHRRSQKN